MTNWNHDELRDALGRLAQWVDEANDQTVPEHRKIDMDDVDSNMLRRAASAMEELAMDCRTNGNAAGYWMDEAVTAKNLVDRLATALKLVRAYMDVCLGAPQWEGQNPYTVADEAIAEADKMT